jgi:hypothetical protein
MTVFRPDEPALVGCLRRRQTRPGVIAGADPRPNAKTPEARTSGVFCRPPSGRPVRDAGRAGTDAAVVARSLPPACATCVGTLALAPCRATAGDGALPPPLDRSCCVVGSLGVAGRAGPEDARDGSWPDPASPRRAGPAPGCGAGAGTTVRRIRCLVDRLSAPDGGSPSRRDASGGLRPGVAGDPPRGGFRGVTVSLHVAAASASWLRRHYTPRRRGG